jgi:quercetin dioxygenase-like cupin family protein
MMTTQRISSPVWIDPVMLISLLIGLGMIFIGARFLVAPEVGEKGFGLSYKEYNYAFHYIKGVRDIFSGLIVVLLAWYQYRRPLFLTLLAGSVIPFGDMLIVWHTPGSNPWAVFIHGGTVVTLWVLCYFLGRPTPETKKSRSGNDNAYAKRIPSVAEGNSSVLELSINPGESTPWHYHRLFSETFDVLKGELTVGRGDQTLTLQQGQTATIQPGQKHFFTNTSGQETLVKVTVSPRNQEFEDSLLIYKGLAKDGLASKSGTPKKLLDLALFIRLNDSHMVGLQKVAEPLFRFLATRATKSGRLGYLKEHYAKHNDLKNR